MSFSCTLGQLVGHVQAKLAVSDQIPLKKLWEFVATYCDGTELDGFQKNVVWRALMASPGDSLLEIAARDEPLEAGPDLMLGAVLLRGSEQEVTVGASEQCRFRYLANTADYEMLKASLGELPFQLLIVVARHGSAGILNADLARESGQDIRSLRLRLQKLTGAGLVVCRNVFINKKHTTLSVHAKFATQSISGDKDDEEESIEATRDVKKLKRLVVAALKTAPNGLRGFSDLKKEFGLDRSHSASKFFRSVCLKMHRQGFIEKLQVELPETKQRVYAMQFVKDLPKDLDDSIDTEIGSIGEADSIDAKEDFGDSDDEYDASAPEMPSFNTVFPPFHQIFHHVYSSEAHGLTSGEICKNLFGVGDYRPFNRLFESLPSYLSNSKNLKPTKKINEPYPETSVTKLYENEGKLKFYKYFATPFCTEEKPSPKPFNFVPRPSNLSLSGLQKKLHVANGKISNAVLQQKRKRMMSLDGAESPVPAKKPKRISKSATPVKNEFVDDEILFESSQKGHKQDDLSAIDVALAAQDNLPRRRRAAPKSFVQEDPLGGEDSGDDYTPKPEEEAEAYEDEKIDDAAVSEAENSVAEVTELDMEVDSAAGPTLSAKDLPTFIPAPKQEKRVRASNPVVKAEGSTRAINRRQHLLDIIREEGGATFKNAMLCRKLDQRLGVSTATDKKTLSRDIVYLTQTGILETQKVIVEHEGRHHDKRILVLKDPKQRPSDAGIERLKAGYAERMSRKNLKMFEKRLIQSDLKLYVEKPIESAVSQNTQRRRGRSRLATLDVDADSEGVNTRRSRKAKDAEMGILDKLKRSKRPSKAQPVSVPSIGPKRPRRNIKLDKSDSTLLYRGVVISKAFSKDAIDFNRIADIIGYIDETILRQKWGTLRRSFGGASAVAKGVETFQNMVMQGIEEGFVTEEDLLEGDLQFFLEFWRKFDSNTEFSASDGMPLYTTYNENTVQYAFEKGVVGPGINLTEVIEDESMRQKEFHLSQHMFTCAPPPVISPNSDDEIRSVLKSIFASEEGTFDPQMVKIVLEKFGDKPVSVATTALLHAREIQYLAFENNTKFVLGERFKAALTSRVLGAKWFQHAACFKELMCDISAARKGLLLSQGIQAGEVACLLEMVSDEMVDFTRIDRPMKFENYESRLVDREQIGCDIVVQVNVEKARSVQPARVNVPVKSPCQPLWVDLNASVNKDLWIKIVIALLAHIVFRPGITDYAIFEKMQAVLNHADYSDAMQWLLDTGCIKRIDAGGYLATNCWQYILGV
ncbi:hypothetical protein OXX79_004362 [Metschnikowia pulcherrima]